MFNAATRDGSRPRSTHHLLKAESDLNLPDRGPRRKVAAGASEALRVL